jgi:hypothetical protein
LLLLKEKDVATAYHITMMGSMITCCVCADEHIYIYWM